MATSDSQADFTSWSQESTVRPLLRMPLKTVPVSTPNNAPLEATKTQVYLPPKTSSSAAPPPSSPSTSDSSPVPIPSLDRWKTATRKPSAAQGVDVVPQDVVDGLPPPESSPAAAKEQLLLEQRRLLEAEHDARDRDLRARMTQPTGRAPSASRLSRNSCAASSSSASSSSALSANTCDRDSAVASAEGDAHHHHHHHHHHHQTSSSLPDHNDPPRQAPLPPTHGGAPAPAEQEEPSPSSAKKPIAASTAIDSPATAQPAEAARPPFPPSPSLLRAEQQQRQRSTDLPDPHSHHSLSLQELRHDVQSCAREIERLVEDQYDLRRSVRDILAEMAGAKAPAAPALAPASPSPSASPASPSLNDATPQQQQQQQQPAPRNSSDGSADRLLSDSSADSEFPSASQPPPPWLLSWMQQQRTEQAKSFQHLREEVVVMICNAVAEVRHASRRLAEGSGDEHGSQRRGGAPPHAVGPSIANHVMEADTLSVRQRGEREEEEQQRNEVDEESLTPLLMRRRQRNRRLMSPTPPNRSDLVSSVASTSESSLSSVQRHDALWSALLRIQRVVDKQSAQIAQLTACVCPPTTPFPQLQAASLEHRQPHQHQHKHREPSTASSITSATASTATTATATTARSDHHHHHHHAPHRKPTRTSSKVQTTHRPLHRKAGRLDDIQDGVSDLRHLLRETLQRDRQLAQRTPDTPISERAHSYQQHPYQQQDRGPSSASSSDVRSSKYAQRRYVPANQQLPPSAPVGSRYADPHPSAARPATRGNGNMEGRFLPGEDTRHAHGVVPQRQQRTSDPRSVPSRDRTPSLSASPVHEERVDVNVYRDDVAADAGGRREEDVLETPPQLPRQRVRTVLTSSLVYPHA
ncbi:hypothetical protein ABB37_08143 [Leptomonas pyrrhocoris]|uniref:Uncharacterized protein n=1 Tax=Leptomonas pyrrhocoris TaxID=157538 RepID=A0A0N0DSF0_LEPPY|nr:hypothetical protein ABB37_08143 [Leptomonas pyrrhocoris]XP_015654432.1 hypothetical protein ABB37_08143 [Leptomonas pyrrhocoris]KPA75992.1 hypothetical protein ABB37_08143 [Leptomonas pyrrhocoris]KPA75993.1 hypothetical protein ABB37_08143 [Leptomonas pyrrhocoris]|eukprot:XP_015654431.1 hypothetical protein ABB37_08143 [Leptomonas pyrrhocoris]